MSLKPAGGALRLEACRMAGMVAVGKICDARAGFCCVVSTQCVESKELISSWRGRGKSCLSSVRLSICQQLQWRGPK